MNIWKKKGREEEEKEMGIDQRRGREDGKGRRGEYSIIYNII